MVLLFSLGDYDQVHYLQWIAFVFIYIVFGWCLNPDMQISRKKTYKQRFPSFYIPIYAFGALFILIITDNFHGNNLEVYFSGMIAATIT